MLDAFSMLAGYLSYPFVRYALFVGMAIALTSSLLGTTLVMKRLSYIGDGLSHVAFGAYAIAAVASISENMLVIVPVTVLAAVLLLQRGQSSRVKGDAAIAMLSVLALAVGYLLMHVFGTSTNISGDVCSVLFGSTSILTLTAVEVAVCAVLALVVVIAFVFLYNRIFSITFDEAFAQATGIKAKRYNLIVAVLIALVIVLGMNLVGALLLSALIVFPSLAAMRVFSTFRQVTVFSAVLSVACALVGMIISMLASTPVGSTIVVLDALAFGVCYLIGRARE